MNKQKAIAILSLIFLIIFISCATNSKTIYPGPEILRTSNTLAYFFPNDNSHKLIIFLGEAGWKTMLRAGEGNSLSITGMAAHILMSLQNTHAILMPEKLKRQPGSDYSKDMDDRARYTLENLLVCYIESINEYLKKNETASIVLIGASEGALLLPLVYEKMNNKEKVDAMVSINYGGLSLYESYKILSTTRSGYPREWVDFFTDILTIFNPENNEFPDSFEEDYYGMTYRYYNSIIHIKPFDYYKNINIPVLFVQGGNNYRIPVESTVYIQENLPEKPFYYKYFLWAETPETDRASAAFIKEIAEWIKNIDE
jgi:pimeloyl-ACP methyl ester carboxylesterase